MTKSKRSTLVLTVHEATLRLSLLYSTVLYNDGHILHASCKVQMCTVHRRRRTERRAAARLTRRPSVGDRKKHVFFFRCVPSTPPPRPKIAATRGGHTAPLNCSVSSPAPVRQVKDETFARVSGANENPDGSQPNATPMIMPQVSRVSRVAPDDARP